MARPGAIIAGVVAVVVVLGGSVASASSKSLATKSQSVTSGTWSLVVTAATSAPYGTGAITVTSTNLTSSAAFPTAVNVGTVPLSTSGFAVSYSVSATGIGIGHIDVYACTTSWNTTTGVCTGGTSSLLATLGSSSTPASPTPRPVAVGAKVPLMVLFAGISIGITATVSATVTRIAGQGSTTTS